MSLLHAMQFALDLAVTSVSLLVIASYSWSLRRHFIMPARVPRGAKLLFALVPAAAALFLYLLWSRHQAMTCQLAGLAVQLAGGWLFWSAVAASRSARLGFAFDGEHVPHGLVTSGPYRYLRHPFYTSYLLFWAGWAIATWSPLAVVPLAAFAVTYMIAAQAEERRMSDSPLAHEYEAYKRRAGFLWPRLGSR